MTILVLAYASLPYCSIAQFSLCVETGKACSSITPRPTEEGNSKPLNTREGERKATNQKTHHHRNFPLSSSTGPASEQGAFVVPCPFFLFQCQRHVGIAAQSSPIAIGTTAAATTTGVATPIPAPHPRPPVWFSSHPASWTSTAGHVQ